MLSKQVIGRSVRNIVCNSRRISPHIQQCRSMSDSEDDIKGKFNQISAINKDQSMFLPQNFSGLLKGRERKGGFPSETDILVVGGGLVGSAVAYFLRTMPFHHEAFKVTVIERDPMYTQSSSMLSVGGIRHQFSLPENIQMSLFTTEFLRNIKRHLSLFDEDPPDVQFNHHGYMFLATEDKVERLQELVEMQRELGAQTTIYSKEKLAKEFPWLNLDGVALGSVGQYGEGWFDPWSLLKALKQKNISLGVQYCDAEVIGFVRDEMNNSNRYPRLREVKLKDKDGDRHNIKFSSCINCAGPWSGEISRMAGVGTEIDPVGVSLPIEPRKRYVYVVHCPEGPGLNAPLTVDTTGAYFRREGLGGCYLMGASPDSEISRNHYKEQEPDASNLDVDYDFFTESIWPRLAHRVPAFEKLKVQSAWAGYYDYNYVDQNLVIGKHPFFKNFIFATGMSGHGIQQALAIGNAVAELLLQDEYQTIDLKRFSFFRFVEEMPVKEDFIV